MGTLFGVSARCERRNVAPGASSLWAALRIDPKGKPLETERAPLAVVLVVDVSPSMQGDAIAHAAQSCEILADLLGPQDQLGIVTFCARAGVRCGLTTMDDAGRDLIRQSVRTLSLDGGTNIHAGIEAAAALLLLAPAGLRRTMVLLSDGQPNTGISTAEGLAAYVRSLRLALSTLGFGVHHDENVLRAIATAGSGRYAYVPDPAIARVELARAALAHGGVVADHIEARIKPGDGVELVRVLPETQMRVGGAGVAVPIGDVFVDEGRVIAMELELDLAPSSRGRLAEIVVKGRAPDGTKHQETVTLEVDVNTGAAVIDRDGQRDVIIVQADAARGDALAQADRGALPAAAAILRQMCARIDASEGFVRDDGSVLADLREQLEDEALMYERKSTDAERAHQRKAMMAYQVGTPMATPAPARAAAPVRARLICVVGSVVGREYPLMLENIIGRVGGNDIPVQSSRISKRHTRILWVNDRFMLQDLGSTNGTTLNGNSVRSAALSDGDMIGVGGDVVFKFVVDP